MNKIKWQIPHYFRSSPGLLKVIFYLLIAFLAIGFLVVRSQVNTYTRQINHDLQAISGDGININFKLEETIPLELSIPIDEIIDLNRIIPVEIPYSAVVPINTRVRIRETIMVPVNMPFIGRTMIEVPLDLDIPINEKIPVDTTITLDPSIFDIPDQVISIEKDIEVSIPLEVNISAADLGIESMLEGIESLVNTLRLVFLLRPT